MKKGYLLLLLGAIPAAGLTFLSALNATNFSETSIDNKNPNLQTRNYKTDLKTFCVKAEEIINTLTTYRQHWRLSSSNVYENSALIKAEVPVIVFTDDLEIKANAVEAKDEILVNVHSKSRVGTNDLGENKRHILQVLEALDNEFNK